MVKLDHLVSFLALAATIAAQESHLPKIPSELRIELVAQPPEVEAVTAVCAAPDGAIYVGCDPMDMGLNTDKPSDYIVRISGSGPNRKITRFADKIGPIMGMQWFRGALYIIHDPYLTVLRDTDGDGVADQRENLIVNLGPKVYPGLNDHIVSGFTLGMDGFFYISVGDKGVFNAKAKDGSSATLHGGGILRVRPDGTELEVFSTGTRNHLEVAMDAADHCFTYDNTDDGNGWWTRVTHHIEGGYYGYPYDYQSAPDFGVTAPSGETKNTAASHFGKNIPPPNESFLPAMADYGGGSPTGGLVYLSDGLPEKYRGHGIFSEWGNSAVFGFEFERDGATFQVKKRYPLVERGNAGEFRPMMLSVGADGSLYICDWQYGGWKNNSVVGRLWRLYWPDAQPAPRLDDAALAKTDLKTLIALLNHPDRDQRLRAQWEIITRFGEKAISPLQKILREKKSPALQKWHAIWTLDGIGGAAPKDKKGDALRKKIAATIRNSLKDSDASVRAQAIRALGTRPLVTIVKDPISLVPRRYNFERVFPIARDATPFLKDADPNVRLQTATALGRIWGRAGASCRFGEGSGKPPHSPRYLAPLMSALDDKDDWVLFAVRTALKRVGDWNAVAPSIEHKDSWIRFEAWLTVAGEYDSEAVKILEKLLRESNDYHTRQNAVGNLALVAFKQPQWDGQWWGTQPAAGKPPAKTVAWQGTEIAVRALIAALEDEEPGIRYAAVIGLAQIPAKTALPELRKRLEEETEATIQSELIAALGNQRDAESVPLLAKFLKAPFEDEALHLAAIEAAEKIGGEQAKGLLVELVASKAALTPTALARAIEALGALKATANATTIAQHLQHKDARVRVAAVKALGKIAPADLADTLIAALADSNSEVQREAMKSLGAMKAHAAVPALLERVNDKNLRADAILALAQMPDLRAVRVYAAGLTDKNRDLREACGKALRAIKEDAEPEIERMIATGEISESAVADFQTLLSPGLVLKWKIIGPFENGWQSAHAPERDALAAIAADAAPDFSREYEDAGAKKARWLDVKAETAEGRLNFYERFELKENVLAYAYAELDAPSELDVKLFCGSDDQIAIWLNGQKIHDFTGDRGWTADEDQVKAKLRAGKNRLLIKCGNHSDGWEFSLRIPGFADGHYVRPRRGAPEEKLRPFALAKINDADGERWANPGDAARGEKIFFEAQGAACFQCHTVRGKGNAVGPDLSDIGRKYPREELVASVLDPSARLAAGYEPSIVQTRDGEVYSGVIKSENVESVLLIGSDRVPHTIAKKDIASRRISNVSTMPTGLVNALKPQEFADLIAFLESLKGETK